MIKILIVEDDMVDQMAISRMIKKIKLPYHFDIAESIQMALDYIEAHNYDLIVSDLNLGDGHAEELLREINNTIPYIIMSGSSPESPIYAPSLKGAIAVLEKDPQLHYLQELPLLLTRFFDSKSAHSSHSSGSITNKPSEEDEVVNIDRLLGLFDHNMKHVKEMIEVFLQQNPVDLQKLISNAKAIQLEEASKTAHKMKSGYNMMGMKRHHQLAETIEDYCQKPQAKPEIVLPMVQELEQKSLHAYQKLQSFIHAQR